MVAVTTVRLAPTMQRRGVRAHAKSSGPSGSKPTPARGPGAAPLRMQTDDQRKFGYGGDGGARTLVKHARLFVS